jgi:drug/metabolite transporter (DMT)-like permease
LHWLALSLICAFCLASSDAAAKRWMQSAGARELVVVRLGLSGLLLTPWVLTFDLPTLPWEFWGWMALLMPLELTAMLLYMRAIRDFPHTQRLSPHTLVDPLKAVVVNPGSRLMLTTAAIYAVTAVLGKVAMQWMPAEQFGAFYFAVLGSLTLLLVGITRPKSLRVGHFGILPLLIVAGFMAVMVITHFMAIAQVEAAYMIAAKRTSLLFGMLYGAMLFGERHLGRHLVAGALMVAGVAAISL